MSANIFISFAAQDRKVAGTLCAAMESRGFECWISSRDIRPGENFQVAIVRAIRKARIMLLVFTASSNNSEEMSKELALASQQKLMVIPLRIEDVKPNDAFQYEFATRQWIDFFADWEYAINQLCSQIANALTAETSTSVPSGRSDAATALAEPVRETPLAEPAAAKPEPAAAKPEPAARVEPPGVPVPPTPAASPAIAPTPVVSAPITPANDPAPPAPQPAPLVAKFEPEAKPTEPVALKPAPKPEPAAKPAPAPKPAPAAAVRAAPQPTPAEEKPKSRVAMFAVVGAVLLILAGLGFAVPALLGKKSEARSVAAAVAPPSRLAEPQTTPAVAPTPAAPAAVAAGPLDATVQPGGVVTAADPTTAAAAADAAAAPTEAKPRPRRSRPVAAPAAPHPRSDVPY